ncbi:TlpA family protein disulfide reductase [Streptomyces sp. NPDC093589]|uniref:TlpA family protein disulfide reductase n=1 Tax=Streptomyces sp. NPDC093589 TaxID=3366043 RepID=UPI00382088B0
MTTPRTLAAGAAAVACLMLAGCSETPPKIEPGTGLTLPTRAPQDRPVAPNLTAPDLMNGKTLKLNTYRGKVVVLNGWSFTCGPCRAETPALQRFQDKNAKNVQVIGLTQDDNQDTSRSFIREFKLTYPSFADRNGKQILRMPRGEFNPQFLPYTAFIDRKGRLAATVSGTITEGRLTAITQRLIKEKP